MRPRASPILFAAAAACGAPAAALAQPGLPVSALERAATPADRLPAEAVRNISSLRASAYVPILRTARLAARSAGGRYYVTANRPGGVCLIVSLRGGRGGQITCDGGPGLRRDGALYPGGPFGRKRQNGMVGLVLDGFDRARMGGVEARVARNVFVLPLRARPAGSLELLGPGGRRTIDLPRVQQFHLEWDVRVRTTPAPRAPS